MAMPIWVKCFKKVYADKDLEYSQDDKFDVPEEIEEYGGDICSALKGVLGEDDEGFLLNVDEAVNGVQGENNNTSTGPSYSGPSKPSDAGVNEKLNNGDEAVEDGFDNMDDEPQDDSPQQPTNNGANSTATLPDDDDL